MCVVSMISDHYLDKWNLPKTSPTIAPNTGIPAFPKYPFPDVTREEFEALRRDVMEMKELLQKAIEYDTRNNEPECHIDEKVEILKKVAEQFGVSLEDVFK